MADIVAIGEPMVEFNQARSADPLAWLQGYGGDTSNMAIAAARLGGRVAYVTRLGADSFGRMFVELWTREGIDTTGVALDPEAPTGVYFVAHGADGHEFSYLRAGSAASRMRPETLPLPVLRSARCCMRPASARRSRPAHATPCSPHSTSRGPPARSSPTTPTCG